MSGIAPGYGGPEGVEEMHDHEKIKDGICRIGKAMRKAALAALVVVAGFAQAAEKRPWKSILLFGQSNMAGGAASSAEDQKENSRVKVLAYDNCSNQGRTYNQWYTAKPSLHQCGTGMGLGDWFGRTVAEALPQDTIALIPCAIPGVDISFFSKNVVSSRRKEFRIPPDNHWTGAYPWMVERLTLAKQKGEIAGILLHQGESDWTDTARKVWVKRVRDIVANLQADVGFGDVPFVAGELRRDGCCAAHNTYIAELVKSFSKGELVSSQGLSKANDQYHLDAAGNREFGKRYAAAFLKVLPTVGLAESPALWSSPRLEGAGGSRSLVFPQSWREIQVVDEAGRAVARGTGAKLELARGLRGILFVRTTDGEGWSTPRRILVP